MSCPAHVFASAHVSAHASAHAPIPSRPVAMSATTAAAAVSPACWRLSAGRAISLGPTVPSQLRIVRGRVWVTMATPALPQTLDAERLWPASGDHVLTAGDVLDVPAGVSLVMEVWPATSADAAQPVLFDWHEGAGAGAAVPTRFQREVVQPAADAMQSARQAASALGQAGWALARAAAGLAGYGDYLLAGRGRVLSPLESSRS